MRRLIFSARSRRDLATIRDHIAQDKPIAALQMAERLVVACAGLSEFPMTDRSGRVAETRELVVVRPYIIVYVVTNSDVRITSIFHAAQDR